MKKYHYILIGLLVVIIGAYVWFLNFSSAPEPETESNQIPIFQTDQNDIVAVAIENQTDSFEVVLTDGVYYFKDDPEVQVIQPKASGLFYDLSSIVAERMVEKDAHDLKQYGLEPAVSVVTARMADGSQHIFYVGNRVQDAYEYYFKTDSSTSVYTLYIGKGQMFTLPKDDFKDKNLTTVSQDQISRVTIKKSDQSEVVVSRSVLDNGAVKWMVEKPYQWQASTSLVQSEILSKITGVSAMEFVLDKSREELGLDQPMVTVSVEKNDGTVVNYVIGKTEGDHCFMAVDGVRDPVSVDSAVTLLAKVDAFSVTEKLIATPSITDIQSVKVKGSDRTVTLNTLKNGDALSYYINGKEATKENYTKIYSEIISLKIDQVSSKKLSNKSGMYLQYQYGDGTVQQYDFYTYDDRNYAVTENGTDFFLIRKTNFDTWFDSLHNVLF